MKKKRRSNEGLLSNKINRPQNIHNKNGTMLQDTLHITPPNLPFSWKTAERIQTWRECVYKPNRTKNKTLKRLSLPKTYCDAGEVILSIDLGREKEVDHPLESHSTRWNCVAIEDACLARLVCYPAWAVSKRG